MGNDSYTAMGNGSYTAKHLNKKDYLKISQDWMRVGEK